MNLGPSFVRAICFLLLLVIVFGAVALGALIVSAIQ